MGDTTKRAMQWIVGSDTGISSETIWSVMQGVKPDWPDTPSDPDDFSRCHKLLTLIPEWRENLKLVAYAYPQWAPLVREWDALTRMYLEGQRTGWKPPYVMYERMQALNDEGLRLCGWTMSSPGCGRGPKRGYRVPREAVEKALSMDARFTPVEQGKA